MALEVEVEVVSELEEEATHSPGWSRTENPSFAGAAVAAHRKTSCQTP